MLSKILKFSAPWCGQCKVLSKELEGSDLPIEEVNCDENEELCDKYHIRNIPVLVCLDENSNEITRFAGVIKLEELRKELNKL